MLDASGDLEQVHVGERPNLRFMQADLFSADATRLIEAVAAPSGTNINAVSRGSTLNS